MQKITSFGGWCNFLLNLNVNSIYVLCFLLFSLFLIAKVNLAKIFLFILMYVLSKSKKLVEAEITSSSASHYFFQREICGKLSLHVSKMQTRFIVEFRSCLVPFSLNWMCCNNRCAPWVVVWFICTIHVVKYFGMLANSYKGLLGHERNNIARQMWKIYLCFRHQEVKRFNRLSAFTWHLRSPT